MALCPDSLKGAILQARLKDIKGDSKGAIEDLRILTLTNPDNFLIYFELGKIYEKINLYKDACKAYRKAIEIMKEKGF